MSGGRGSSGEGQWITLSGFGRFHRPAHWSSSASGQRAEIPLTRSELDADAIIEAASRATSIFPSD
jgi:hypothetical protein